MRIQTFIVILAFLVMMTSHVQAGDRHRERGTTPTASGRQGGVTVFSAEPVQSETFGFGYQKEYFQSKTIPFEGRNNVHGGQIFLNYAPFHFLQLFLNRKTVLINNEDLFPILQSHSFSKSEAGAMISFPLSRSAFLGVEGNYALFNGNGIEDIDKAGSWGAKILNSWKTALFRRKYPLKFHLNTLYFRDRSHEITSGSTFEALHLLGVSQFDMLQYGLGTELETSLLSPFVEYTLDHTLDSGIPIFKNPNRLTTGFKITPTSAPWQIQLGSQFGFSTKHRFEGVALTPKLNFFAGISYQTPQKRPLDPTPRVATGPGPSDLADEDLLPTFVPLTPLSEEEMKQYPIYTIEEAESVIKVQKVRRVKKIKKQAITIKEETTPKIEEKTITPEKSEPKQTSPEQPKEFESTPGLDSRLRGNDNREPPHTPDPSDTALKEVFKSRSDSNEKGFEEETPNKNFLIHFR